MTPGIYTLLSGYGTWIEMSSTATLLVRDQMRILFDTGAVTERKKLLKALDKLDLRPEDIDIVANTHLHMDHCENNPLFPRADWFCSDMEHDNLIEMVAALNTQRMDLKSVAFQYLALPGGMPKTLFEKVARFFSRDGVPEKMLKVRRIGHKELNALGIRVIATPGHTDGHVSFVYYDPNRASDIIIAGDVIVARNHFQPGRRSLFTKDTILAERSKQKLSAYRGWCLPGHGEAFIIPERQTGTHERTIASINPPFPGSERGSGGHSKQKEE